jgi:hypothetical protein
MTFLLWSASERGMWRSGRRRVAALLPQPRATRVVLPLAGCGETRSAGADYPTRGPPASSAGAGSIRYERSSILIRTSLISFSLMQSCNALSTSPRERDRMSTCTSDPVPVASMAEG